MPSYQSSHTGAEHDQYVTKADLVDLIYPIGAIYISASSADPGLLFGGTWTQIEDKFLLCAGSTYTAGTSGGSASVNLAHSHTTNAGTTGGTAITIAQMPSHNHPANGVKGLYLMNEPYSNPYSQSGGNTGAGGVYTTWQWGNNANPQGGGKTHTHSQVAVGTDSKLSSTQSILPPYLSVYVWQRTG